MPVMHVKEPKNRRLDHKLEEKSIEFHGHGGPFMVIGLRMGTLALRLLDAHGWFDVHTSARLNWAPPDSCVIDGLMSSTGCTMGKRNMEVHEVNGIAADFAGYNKIIRVTFRDSMLQTVRSILATQDDGKVRVLMDELETSSDEQLFQVKILAENP